MLERAVMTGRHIIEESKDHVLPTFAYSVLDNYITGDIVSDEGSLLIGTSSGIYVAVGNEQNANFSDLLVRMFMHRKNSNQRFTLFSPTQAWDGRINQLFGGELKSIQRYSFHFNESDFSRRSISSLPSDYQCKPIGDDTLQSSRDFNESYVIKYWGSVERFLEKGFGYCITQSNIAHSNVHASECISIFSSSGFAEVDIATNDQFRGKGFAQFNAEAFILECIERELTPRWDCDIHNTASIRLAGKLGFANPAKYSVFVRN